jgi:DNA-binding response OmpR family regulator
MTKPFSPRELVARVMALLRRARSYPAPADGPFTVGNLEIDPARRQVRRDGELVHLTPIEFELLNTLASRPGVVFTRDQLLSEVWGYNDGFGARTIDSHVGALRRKLGSELFRTVHGVGYAVEA